MTTRWPSFLLFLACAVATVAPAANAASRHALPQIDTFRADPRNQLTPGTEIVFRVQGTPAAQASVSISGIPRNIPLKEVEPGVYEGSYTIRSADTVAADAMAHATLRAHGRIATANLAFRTPPAVAAAPVAPVIERFSVLAVDKIEPGADLRFTIIGTPGGRASVTIFGVARDIPLREVKSGHYEGSYTVRRVDQFPSNVSIVGSLEAAGHSTRARLNEPLIAVAKAPLLKNVLPPEGEKVPSGPVTVTATFEESARAAIDTKTVRVVIDGKDVTQLSSITRQYFTYHAEMGPGPHQVTVSARDTAGNAMRHSWSFSVAGHPAVLPLQISSHANNATVTSGPVEVRGRTAPGAEVDVQVSAVASFAGLFGLNQQVLSQTLRADGKGDFAFSFQSPVPVPGTRYEISLKARTAEASREMELVLFQQK